MEDRARITRRTAIKSAAGASIGIAAALSPGLPAWARHVTRALNVKGPGTLPDPSLPEGTPTMPQIEHIVVVMMENHAFDNIIGVVPKKARRGPPLDGLPVQHGEQTAFNSDSEGNKVFSQHADTVCQDHGVPSQAWNASHISYGNGRNDGFVLASGPRAMRYYDETDLPFTYSLAKHFPIGQRYFCSCLAQTYPQFRYLLTGTSSGIIRTDASTFSVPAANGTIYDRFDQFGIDWKNYFDSLPASLVIPGVGAGRSANFVKGVQHFIDDAAAGRLPGFSFVNPDYESVSEENPQDVQFGDGFLAKVTAAVTSSPKWDRTVLFITYDEHGGYYDHVPPPAAIKPDGIPPLLKPGDVPGAFDRYGFRVPLIVVSPWARKNYVSNVVQDHTSITRFIERKWNLGAMTFRDANAADMTNYFNFSKAHFADPPALAAAPDPGPGLEVCAEHGQFPPLPPSGTISKRSGGRQTRIRRGLPQT
jgi:phospholipase C